MPASLPYFLNFIKPQSGFGSKTSRNKGHIKLPISFSIDIFKEWRCLGEKCCSANIDPYLIWIIPIIIAVRAKKYLYHYNDNRNNPNIWVEDSNDFTGFQYRTIF